MMERIRKDYNSAQKGKVIASNLIKISQPKCHRSKEEMRAIMVKYYWKMNKNPDQFVHQGKAPKVFDVESFIKITPQERLNLLMLQIFNDFHWFKEDKVCGIGSAFGHESLDWGGKQSKEGCCVSMYSSHIKCLSNVSLATLHKNNFAKVIRRIRQDEEKNLIEMVNALPKFKSFSYHQVKKVIRNSFYKNFNKGQYVFMQNKLSEHVYVVVDGQFEVQQRTKYH